MGMPIRKEYRKYEYHIGLSVHVNRVIRCQLV